QSSGRSGSAVTVQDVGFRVDGGESILTIDLSSAAEVIEPVADGQTIRFGIRNAEISRALRRTIDATAFPSAVRTITPLSGGRTGRDPGGAVCGRTEGVGPLPAAEKRQQAAVRRR
ncbi:MAG: hypothetical protein IH614_05215, partial [Desulfuromonadales bacterium]|nr:hypothetical protein [Desulfuromonadales bacterium]